MTKTVTTEVIEETPAAPAESKEATTPTEPALEEMESKKEETQEAKEESKEAAEESKQAAETATKAAEQAKSSTSYNEFALKGLMDSVTLVAQRMEQVMNIAKQMAEDFQKVNEELRLTTELHQEQIAEIDSAANKVTTAAAALVKLHQAMTTEE